MGLKERVFFGGFVEVDLGLHAGLDQERTRRIGRDALARRGRGTVNMRDLRPLISVEVCLLARGSMFKRYQFRCIGDCFCSPLFGGRLRGCHILEAAHWGKKES